jgi:hypothetical protein
MDVAMCGGMSTVLICRIVCSGCKRNRNYGWSIMINSEEQLGDSVSCSGYRMNLCGGLMCLSFPCRDVTSDATCRIHLSSQVSTLRQSGNIFGPEKYETWKKPKYVINIFVSRVLILRHFPKHCLGTPYLIKISKE